MTPIVISARHNIEIAMRCHAIKASSFETLIPLQRTDSERTGEREREIKLKTVIKMSFELGCFMLKNNAHCSITLAHTQLCTWCTRSKFITDHTHTHTKHSQLAFTVRLSFLGGFFCSFHSQQRETVLGKMGSNSFNFSCNIFCCVLFRLQRWPRPSRPLFLNTLLLVLWIIFLFFFKELADKQPSQANYAIVI